MVGTCIIDNLASGTPAHLNVQAHAHPVFTPNTSHNNNSCLYEKWVQVCTPDRTRTCPRNMSGDLPCWLWTGCGSGGNVNTYI